MLNYEIIKRKPTVEEMTTLRESVGWYNDTRKSDRQNGESKLEYYCREGQAEKGYKNIE